MYHWKAEVTVSGVPHITDAEFEDVHVVVKGTALHDSIKDELAMVWRFDSGSPDIDDACEVVGARWRTAVAFIESAVDPVCTDFRVHQVEEL